MDRADIVHENFLQRVQIGDFPGRKTGSNSSNVGLSRERLLGIFKSQILSRQLDRISRKLQARGEGYYTIGSSGHEGSAAVAAAFRLTDLAFLHYRDAAFQIERASQIPDQTPMWNILLSFCTSKDDPISGGRHKVLGSKELFIPPQTSTIASHLPKAVGAAYSLGLARKLKPEHRQLPNDGVVLCSFGDASFNHSTAQGALNAAAWTAYRQGPLPLVFICEDNGIGISTKTPDGWIEANVSSRAGLEYFQCNGLDVVDTYEAASRVANWVRTNRKPAFLHMSCVRLYGHAGADAQTAYLPIEKIEADEADDPLLHSARILIEDYATDAVEILKLYNEVGAEVAASAEKAIKRPRLKTSGEVMESIIPPSRKCAPTNGPSADERSEMFGKSDMRGMDQPQNMAKLINFTLSDLMLEHREIVLAGEDIGQKGGVYGVTQRLLQRFGGSRVIDTLLDEQSILGLSIGLAHNGILPVSEIQFLAYLHNAEDQLRGEAATLSFFSNGQYTNPMVIRIAGLGYQRGFGGHFHNDNSLAVLRDIPGLIIACPSNGHDAACMLRECVRLAREEQRIVIFIEPIALYMTRDLHEEGDGLWSQIYPKPAGGQEVPIGQVGVVGEGTDLAIITYGNGNFLSQQAMKILAEAHNLDCRVIDIRWIAPLPGEGILKKTRECGAVLIVDECRTTGSQSEAIMTLFAENPTARQKVGRLAADDSFIATGPAFGATLPSRDAIVGEGLKLAGRGN